VDFWSVISGHCATPLNVANASERLEAALREMPGEEVLEFCRAFDEKMEESYIWELWGVAYLINGGCSDDSFLDFRASLIALGEQAFEAAKSDAESLLHFDRAQLTEMFEEGLLYCGPTAFEAVAGSQVDTGVERREQPAGAEWEETAASLSERFPKAWKIYGWDETGAQGGGKGGKPWWRFW